MRVLIVGTAGSGKTTLAREIAMRHSIPHVELDAVYWGSDWTPMDRVAFRDAVLEILASMPDWVIDGNYRSVRDAVVSAADEVVWLDLPVGLCLWRLVRRTSLRILRRDRLFHGNRESARELVRTRFEFIRWAVREHRRLRTEIPELAQRSGAPKVVRIRHRRDLAELHHL